jgi:rhodanese-related sulfurtransferase
MKKFSFILVATVFLAFSCKTTTEKPSGTAVSQPQIKTEAALLEEYLAASGDYVNSRQFPSMIKSETVLESLDSSSLVIDLREPASFARGHIKGAVNVEFSDLPSYFESTIRPYEYEKIIVVCAHGQRSGYATLLLRLMGYGNVYSMRWGMAAWNPKLAEDRPWSALISSDYSSKLETKENLPAAPGNYPELATGKTTGEEIFKERIKQIFAEGFTNFTISAGEVFENPDSFYIINYERKDKYDAGHIPGAVRYKPGATLGIEAEMRTIPAGKEVAVYCATGHNSAFVVAYLRLLGYNAHSIRYGNNSFMYDKMLEDEVRLSWEVFSDKEMLKNYPFVK